MKAADVEFSELIKRGTFKEIGQDETTKSPLPLLWVFKYKFDEDGHLSKFKARICVRGDLQYSTKDNYAATLACKTFRALMAITAAFDLEIVQLDAVNAFLNSDIDEEVYVDFPEGFKRSGRTLLLLKALYGLKQAPLLWYQHLHGTLVALGLKQVDGVDCLLTNGWLIVFFYVDDIILLFPRHKSDDFEAFYEQLKARYGLRRMPEANWFLGIRITRNREILRLSLSQDSYIEKLSAKFHVNGDKLRHSSTPLSEDDLRPHEGKATAQEILGYQQKIGSLNFAAVYTRPDIAKACSVLSQFLVNPSPIHLAAADRVLAYLDRTKDLSLVYDGLYQGKVLEIFGDAAYANHHDRKSSDGILFSLYGGPIDWRASKQTTVTTSSTEAELLTLSRTGKDTLWWRHFFRNINFSVDEAFAIQCDNTATIRLICATRPQLSTKLRHVEIHHFWLRQFVQRGDIVVEWVPSQENKADGFTKALSRQNFEKFISQLNLSHS